MRTNLNYLTQGCTTVVSGNRGMGSIDIAAYFSPCSSRDGSGTNVILLGVPHGPVRERAMGGENRPPTPAELERMRDAE